MTFKKLTGKDLIQFKWKKEKEEMDKLYKAKQEGKERRKEEREKNKKLTDLPNNLQKITTVMKGDEYGTNNRNINETV